jgi:hypothetical protein
VISEKTRRIDELLKINNVCKEQVNPFILYP